MPNYRSMLLLVLLTAVLPLANASGETDKETAEEIVRKADSQTEKKPSSSLNYYPASSDDLADKSQGFVASITSDYEALNSDFSDSVDKLFDGSSNSQGVLMIGKAGTKTYQVLIKFDISKHPRGYNIKAISTIASWGDRRRSQQLAIFYRTVGSTKFKQLVSEDDFQIAVKAGDSIDNGSGNFATGGSTKLTIRDGESLLASNVEAIRFDVFTPASIETNTQESAGVYREFDIFGAPVSE